MINVNSEKELSACITKPKRKKMPADTTDEKQKNEVQTPTKVTKVQKPSGDEQFEEMVNNMPV